MRLVRGMAKAAAEMCAEVTPSEHGSVFCCDSGSGESPSLLSFLHAGRAGQWGGGVGAGCCQHVPRLCRAGLGKLSAGDLAAWYSGEGWDKVETYPCGR